MRIVIADTGPIHYLVLIGYADILPALFVKVIVPSVVLEELTHAETPPAVRSWMAQLPVWLEVRQDAPNRFDEALLEKLDDGEGAVIGLAASLKADLLLMDDRKGVKHARHKGFGVTGTLGILELAAERGLLDLGDAFSCLKATSFRCPQKIMNTLLARSRH